MTLPLFEKYPVLAGRVPWMPIGNYPTPVHKLGELGRAAGYENIWIKRDDKSSDIYGGNKVRKLEFAIADALRQKKKYIITPGGIGTNHGLATAVHGGRAGLKVVLVLIPQPVTSNVQENLLLDRHFGAEIIVGSSIPGAYLQAVWAMLTHPNFYLLWTGGTSALSTLGYINAVFELRQQVEAGLLPAPAYIFGATGSMGTTAGLIVGARLAGLKSRIVGVRVSMESYSNVRGIVSLCNKTAALMRRYDPSVPEMKFTAADFDLNTDFFGGEYGRVTPEGMAAVELIRETEGIRLETTYTGKALAAMLDFVKRDKSLNGTPVLFWNTFNGVDFSRELAADHDYTGLPGSVQWCFDEKLAGCLREK